MKSIRRAAYMATVSLMLASLSYGQGASVADKGGGKVVEFIPLTHADAQTVAKVVTRLGLPVAVVAAPDGKILVSGEEADVAQVLDVVAKLDMPEASAASGVRTEFIPLGDLDTSSFVGVLSQLIRGSQSKYSVDAYNHMLVVRAREDEIAAVKELLGRLDRPLDSVTVDLFFLRAMIGSADGNRNRELPSALAPIAKTLAANGFAEISLMAPIRLNCRMVRAFSIRGRRTRHEFSISSRLRTNPTDDGKLGDDLKFTVNGGVRPTAAQDTVELTVDAGINGHLINAELAEVGDIDFGVQATIAAKFGQYVVLSAAPSSTATGEAVAVVVRVTRDSSQ